MARAAVASSGAHASITTAVPRAGRMRFTVTGWGADIGGGGGHRGEAYGTVIKNHSHLLDLYSRHVPGSAPARLAGSAHRSRGGARAGRRGRRLPVDRAGAAGALSAGG